MAKATTETITVSIVLPNQHKIAQNQTPKIPHPRIKHTEPRILAQTEQTSQLFTKTASTDALEAATKYIDDVIKTEETIKTGSFLIGLLEKLQIIPPELSAEDTTLREAGIAEVEELLLALTQYKDHDNTLDSSKFQSEVIDVIGRENTSGYPIITLLRDAIKRVRNSNNRSAEPQINTAQQVALLGISRQIRAAKQ